MNIYKISHDEQDYDVFMGHVIVASNKIQVVQLAIEISRDEGKDVWLLAPIEEVGVYNGDENEPFILLSDYHGA